jgi:hypothetical protein
MQELPAVACDFAHSISAVNFRFVLALLPLTPSSAEVKNERSYTSAPPISLHGVHRDNVTFYLHLFCYEVPLFSLPQDFVVF